MKTTFSKSGITVLIFVLLLGLTGCVEPDAEYKTLTVGTASMLYECAERGITMPCEQLTPYVSPVGKCWNIELGNKICKQGWKEVNDLPKCLFYGPTSKIYICDTQGCVLRANN